MTLGQAITVALFSGDKRAVLIPGIKEKQIIGITKGYIFITQQYAANTFACICTSKPCFFSILSSYLCSIFQLLECI